MSEISVKKRNGRLVPIDLSKINKFVDRCCVGIDNVSASEIVLSSEITFRDKIPTQEIDKQLELTARSKIWKHPNYGRVAANIVLSSLYKEVLKESVVAETFDSDYRSMFIKNIKAGVKEELLDERLLNFDLKKLADYLQPERDNLFQYVGIRNIYDRYLLKSRSGKVLETPQAFYMRVAMGLSLYLNSGEEGANEELCLNLYDVYSQHLASPSTPTLFNSGTTRSQLSSCYLSRLDDSVDGIFDALWQEARKSKFAGGLGFHVSSIRSTGGYIKGTNGTSSGLIPWLKLYNDMLIACNQCFAPDTKIICKDGVKKIQDVEIGDEVLSMYGFSKVVNTFKQENSKRMISIKTPVAIEEAVCTEDHRIWATLPNELPDWVEAGQLTPNHLVCLPEGEDLNWFKVESVKEAEDCPITYDLQVEDHPSYCTTGFLCHNSGKRPGSGCAYLEPWHGDIREFITLRTNTGDEQRKCRQMNIALWCPDLFFERIQSDSNWTLFSPSDTPDLPDLYGEEFKKKYEEYEKQGIGKTIKAKDLWKDILKCLFETSHPWICFKDQSNKCYSNKHMGTVYGSNLCCVTGDQRVPTQYGILKVEELEKLDGDLVVASFQGEEKATKIYKIKNAPVFEFVLKNGLTHKITADHPLWVKDKGWVNAEDLCVGMQVHIQSEEGVFGPEDNYEEAYLNGKFLDDNYEEFPRFLFTSNKKSCLGFLEGLRENNCKITEPRILNDLRIFLSNLGLEETKDLRVKFLNDHNQEEYVEITHKLALCNEDTYCLKVLSNPNCAWVCNGFITKNSEIILRTNSPEYNGEFGEKTKHGLTAVCTLSSICLPNHMYYDGEWHIDYDKVQDTIEKMVIALDNVISTNFYPTKEAKIGATSDRPIGIGTIGWADVYIRMGISPDSEEAKKLAAEIMENISYYAVNASAELAQQRGPYPTFQGSSWSKGKFHHENYDVDTNLDWEALRHKIKAGMRNSNLLAIAPNASIGFILGYNQSIEPYYSLLYTYENKSGKMLIINQRFVEDMEKEGLWSPELAERVKFYDGDVSKLDIPDKYKAIYKNAFDLDQVGLINVNSERQKWVDQAISFNLYNNKTSIKYLNDIYMAAWKHKLKTTYYLRNKRANEAEKTEEIEVKEVKACPIDGSCESCEG